MKKWKGIAVILATLLIAVLIVPITGCKKTPPPTVPTTDYPEMPKAEKQAKKFNLINRNDVSESEMLALITLQGVTANLTDEQIFFTDEESVSMGNVRALEYVKENYGVQTETFTDAWALMDKYKSLLNGYILCNLGTPSVNIATGFAGAKTAIAVDAEIETEIQEKLGLTKLKDFRGVNELQLTREYLEQEGINNQIACEITYDVVNFQRDYSAMSSALTFWCGVGETRDRMIDQLGIAEEGFIMGYGDYSLTGDESQFVSETSKKGINYVPCDWIMNASVLSGFELKTEQLTQKAPKKVAEYKESAHRVVFVMSDGDNVQWNTNNLYNSQWWGSADRGSVPVTWTISPRLNDLAPMHLDMRYSQATENDCLVPYDSSLLFHSLYPDSATKKHAKRLSDDMKCLDARTDVVLGFRGFIDDEMWSEYMAYENIDGILYNEFWGLDNGVGAWRGTVQWVGGKPIVSCAYELNRRGSMSSMQELDDLVAYVNAKPTDPSISDGYTVVYCNNWTTWVSDLKYMADRFDDDVEVVTGEQLIDMMYHYNVKTPEFA